MKQYKNYTVAIFARNSSNKHLVMYYILKNIMVTICCKCAYCSCINLREVQII